MSDATPTVREDGAPLSLLATTANEEHRAAEEAARSALEHARGAGEALNEAKDRVEHGEWTAWLEDHFDATPRTARSYMRIARRWDELEEAQAENGNALPIREAIRFLAEPPGDDEDDGEDEGERQGRLIEVDSQSEREQLEAALQRLPKKERDRARKLLVRPGEVPVGVMVRQIHTLADATRRERKWLYKLSEKSGDAESDEPLDVQLGLQKLARRNVHRLLPQVAHSELYKVLASSGRLPKFERWGGKPAAEARPVLTLQALLRWAVAFCDVVLKKYRGPHVKTDERFGPILDGLWVARRPAKIADDALRVADFLTDLAAHLPAGPGLPAPADVVQVGKDWPTSPVVRRT